MSVTTADAIQLATEIGRKGFGTAYKTIRRQVGAPSPPFLSIAMPYPGDDRAAIRAGVEAARRDQWLESLVAELATMSPKMLPVELQTLVEPQRGYADIDVVAVGLGQLARQTCAIELAGDDSSYGTGFLVGPDVIMTCWHVISPLLDDEGKPSPDSGRRLRFIFDKTRNSPKTTTYNARDDDWLVCGSETELLDYVVVRVQGAPGAERSWLRLASAEAPTTHYENQLWVFQHPSRSRLVFDRERFERSEPAANRILYSVNTARGSSGGPVVNDRYAFVGLHAGALKDDDLEPGDPKLNVGVSGMAIVDDLREKWDGVALERPLLENITHYRTDGNRGPIIGRKDCQQKLLRCRSGASPIFTIYSEEPRSGKSFTYQIMRACLPSADNTVTALGVDQNFSSPIGEPPAAERDVRLTAKGVVEELLQQMQIDHSNLPAFEGGVQPSRYVKEQLFPEFRRRVEQGDRPGHIRWIVVDDIDQDRLLGEGVRLFFECLHYNISQVPGLRIVLIGYDGVPAGANPDHVLEELIKPPTDQDLAQYLRLRYVASGLHFGSDEIERTAKLTYRSGGREQIEALSGFVGTHVDGMIRDIVRNGQP